MEGILGRMAAEFGDAMQVGRGQEGTMGRPDTDLEEEGLEVEDEE